LSLCPANGFSMRRPEPGGRPGRSHRNGAVVIGVDIGSSVIEAPKTLAPDIDFPLSDAEALPFGETVSTRSRRLLASCLSLGWKSRRAS